MRITINSLLEKQQHVFKEAIETTRAAELNPISEFALESEAFAV